MDDEDPTLRTTVAPARRASAADRPPRGELRIVMPAALAATIPVGDGPVTLGRNPDGAGVVIAHESVSRTHLAVEWDARARFHTARDLGSSFGSYVDAMKAVTPLPLADGAVIRLGPGVVMVYQSPGAGDDRDGGDTSLEAIPGQAPATRALRAAIGHVAPDPSPVLLVGETGTGKELIAEEIHRLSARPGELVAINCAALSPALIESELFGHVRGAFTGATDAQPGLFREADRGTLLLDEIGELPADLQPKLLRAIQEKEVRPVGTSRSVAVDVRVVAATNRPLAAEVEAGTFRRDLYARLSLWEVKVPPLRRRRGDLFMWIDRLYRRWLVERARPAAPGGWTFEAVAAEALLLREWRDNLRGVDRLVHALAAGSTPGGEPLTFAQLPAWLWEGAGSSGADASAPTPTTASGAASLREPARAAPTKDELVAALARHDGSVRATAKYYGRDRRQIYRWMEAFGLKEK